MLKFDKIIHRLTLEEKVELLVSSTMYENSRLDDFDLPRFKINTDKKIHSLAACWDMDLIRRYAKNKAEHRSYKGFAKLYGFSLDNKTLYNAKRFSSDDYLSGKCAAMYLKGINEGSGYSALISNASYHPLDEEVRRESLLAAEVAIKEGHPSAILTESADNLDIIRDEFGYNGSIFMEGDGARGLANGCHFIFSADNPKERILEAVRGYIQAKDDKSLTIVDLDQMEREGKILNPERLDLIIDEYLDFLFMLDKNENEFKAKTDNDSLDYELARKSIIMLKNDGVLPLLKHERVLLCGSNAFKGDDNSAVVVAEGGDVNITASAHGYSFDLNDDFPLINEAIDMARGIKTVLVYLKEKDGVIPDNQMELLEALREKEKTIIAFVEADGEIKGDRFYSLCDAVIQSAVVNKEVNKLVLKLIDGEYDPQGRTSWVSKLDNGDVRYPLCYGLSFNSFDYNRMSVDKHGVALTVRNNGHLSTSDVLTLYVEYENDGITEEKLRSFSRIDLKSGESGRVFLDFDEFTFKSYNKEEKCDEIKSGTYYLRVYDAGELKLESKVELTGKLINKNGYTNEIAEYEDDIDTVLNKFRDSKDRRSFFEDRRQIKFKTKMIIWSLVFLYFNISFIYVGLTFIGRSTPLARILFDVFIGVFNIVAIVLLIILIKNKRKGLVFDETKLSNVNLDNIVENMNKYVEVARETYPKPIAVEPEEEDIVEEAEKIEDEVVEEDKKKEYLESDYECDEGGIDFAEDIYPAEYVQAYNDYSSNNGVIIEPKSSRALFSALGSTHLLILKSGVKDLLYKTFDLVLSYLGNDNNVFDLSGVNSLDELLIEKIDDETYKKTKLNGLLSNMRKLKKTCNILVFKNADMSNLRNTLGSLIDFIINPNGDYYINLGTKDDEDLVLIPKNLTILVEPSDNDYLDHFDKELAERSLSIELLLRVNELEPIEAPEIKYMSYPALERMAKDCKSRNIIPEEYWKKLDDLEEEINNLEPFRIENKTILDFERFVGLMIEAGGDIDEAIDMALAYRIVPILKSYNVYKNNDGDNTLYEIIERIFTAENTELTKRAIKKSLE